MERITKKKMHRRARHLAAACLAAFACSALAQTEVLLEVRQFALEGENPLSEQET